MTFHDQLLNLLKTDPRFVDDAGELVLAAVQDAAWKTDRALVKLLLGVPAIEDKFFVEVDGRWIFDVNAFINYISEKNFLDNAYTRFKNRIGLTIGGKFLRERGEVALAFPYKDCVLEGGQTRDEQRRSEIFFNEVLAQDEISRLLDPKVLTNFKRYTAAGVQPVDALRRDENGILRENLLIKGNNLLVLHTLKTQLRGQVKLIYIDPPYNPDTKTNTFAYNNNFNHSTWLTFMQNRLDVAKQLLTKDGVLVIAIDDNEVFYLGVMLGEIFPDHEIHCITIVHNPRGIQGTNFSYTHEYAFFVIPKGRKVIGSRKINDDEIDWSPLRNWGGESLRQDARNCFYPIIVEDGEIVGFGDVLPENEHPTMQTEQHENRYYVYPIDKNGIERKWRYARQSIDEIKHLLRAKPMNDGYDIEIGKDFGVYKSVWQDSRYDANAYGTKIVSALVENNTFSFPKSLWNVYDCLYAVVANDKDAIVLDFFAGSGTTAHAVLELNKEDGGNRQFILCEQMDYVETVTRERIHKVMEQHGGGDFVYCELLPYNQTFVERIQAAHSSQELLQIWHDMAQNSFLKWYVNPRLPEEAVQDFMALGTPTQPPPNPLDSGEVSEGRRGLNKQKHLLLDLLDKNQLYVNFSEIDDAMFNVSAEDKALTRAFYGGNQ